MKTKSEGEVFAYMSGNIFLSNAFRSLAPIWKKQRILYYDDLVAYINLLEGLQKEVNGDMFFAFDMRELNNKDNPYFTYVENKGFKLKEGIELEDLENIPMTQFYTIKDDGTTTFELSKQQIAKANHYCRELEQYLESYQITYCAIHDIPYGKVMMKQIGMI